MNTVTGRQIEWEHCPIPSETLHTQYRGFDVHMWHGFLCFYATEGEATEDELKQLLDRINEAGLGNLIHRFYRYGNDYPIKARQHPWAYSNSTCSIKERLDGQMWNWCLETPDLDSLDAIIDGLWELTGLTKRVSIQEGRVF